MPVTRREVVLALLATGGTALGAWTSSQMSGQSQRNKQLQLVYVKYSNEVNEIWQILDKLAKKGGSGKDSELADEVLWKIDHLHATLDQIKLVGKGSTLQPASEIRNFLRNDVYHNNARTGNIFFSKLGNIKESKMNKFRDAARKETGISK